MLTPKVLSLSLVSPAAGPSMPQEFCFEGIPPNFVSAGACELHTPSKDRHIGCAHRVQHEYTMRVVHPNFSTDNFQSLCAQSMVAKS